jgi:DNA-binding transcriptional LysR family regulator
VENQLEELARGNLDFAIHIRQADYGPEFQVELLGGSPPGILVRRGHPLTEGPVTLERLADYPLIRLYISDVEQLEILRNSAGYSSMLEHQRGTLEISHLLTALEVLRNTDYFMPGPVYIAQEGGTTQDIVALPAPNAGGQNIDYALVAHNRTANSPLHQWLWEQIRCTIRDLRTHLPHKARRRFIGGARSTV